MNSATATATAPYDPTQDAAVYQDMDIPDYVDIDIAKYFRDNVDPEKVQELMDVMRNVEQEFVDEQKAFWPSQKAFATRAHDTIVRNGHNMHAIVANEAYSSPGARRGWILGWKLVPMFSWRDYCTYRCGDRIILGMRGTVLQGVDLWDDIVIAYTGESCTTTKSELARQVVRDIKSWKPTADLSITGHSLGGAAARCVGEAMNIRHVTFNAAAPPTWPVINKGGRLGTHYHMAYDIVSAWSSPGLIRLELPDNQLSFLDYIRKLARELAIDLSPSEFELGLTVTLILEACQTHSMALFFNNYLRHMTAKKEDEWWKKWWSKRTRTIFMLFLTASRWIQFPTIKE